MPKPITGIAKLTGTSAGITFLHADGATMLRAGSKSQEIMGAFVELSQLALAERSARRELRKAEQVASSEAASPKPPATSPFGFNPIAWLFGKPEAPTAMRVLNSPQSPGRQSPPQVSEGPRRPTAPIHGSYQDSALARRLAFGYPGHPSGGRNPLLLLHHWEIREGKSGFFLRGRIAGHPHYPDNSMIETPYMREYHPDHNIFLLADGTAASLGQVHPGSVRRQSTLLHDAQRTLMPQPPPLEANVSPPDVTSVDVCDYKVRIRFSDKSSFSAGPNERVGLAFSALVSELEAAGVKIKWNQAIHAPAPTSAQSVTPAAQEPAQAQPVADNPELPPVPHAEAPESGVSFESLEPTPLSPNAKRELEPTLTSRVKLLRVISPKEGKSQRMSFVIETEKGEIVVQAPEKIEGAIASVVLSGRASHALIRFKDNSTILEGLYDEHGNVMKNEDVEKIAEEIRQRAAKLVASTPSQEDPAPDIKPAAPSFRAISPPAKKTAGPELN